MTTAIGRRFGSHSTLVESLAVGALAIVLLAVRAPFARDRLWAEDGSIFLQQPISRGVIQPFGQAYAGYYLFVPRVIGAVAALVPIRAAAFTTWLGVALVIGWCAATIYAESAGLLTSFPTRALLALSIVALPALGLEAIANAADLQYTLLFTALVALTGMSTDRWSQVNRMAIVVVTSFTTPLALLLAPVAALRILRSRPRRIDSTFVAWAGATALQLLVLLVVRPRREIGTPSVRSRIFGHYLRRVLYSNLLPKRFSTSTATLAPLVALICLALVALAVVLAWRRRRRAHAALLVAIPGIGLAFWVFAALRYGLPARYRVFPALCVIWAVLVAWEEVVRAAGGVSSRRRVDWRMSGIVVVLIALAWATYWRPVAYRRSGPAWSREVSAGARVCRTLHQPAVSLRISPVAPGSAVRHVRVPCADLE